MRYEFIDVGYHVDPAESAETDEVMRIEYPIPIEIAGQSVLVLKDVVSSGVTEPYLEQQLRDHGAAKVRFAALIDLPDERKTAFDLPYSALTTHRRGVLVDVVSLDTKNLSQKWNHLLLPFFTKPLDVRQRFPTL